MYNILYIYRRSSKYTYDFFFTSFTRFSVSIYFFIRFIYSRRTSHTFVDLTLMDRFSRAKLLRSLLFAMRINFQLSSKVVKQSNHEKEILSIKIYCHIIFIIAVNNCFIFIFKHYYIISSPSFFFFI